MAHPPRSDADLIAEFGPHLAYEPPGGWHGPSAGPPPALVKTHCCFCGQQCGIQLKVRDNKVIGFEPWEEFPFNRGMLCPKGVRRYLQDNHRDRLTAPLVREASGFRPTTWDDALARTVRGLQEIQAAHGKDAVAVLGGASLTSEKSYLVGKLARVALGTRHVDYNGRLCMVSAGVPYKHTFGVDRSPNPWSDIPKAQVLFIIGANIAECAPITTDYVWRCKDAGGTLIVADPRATPITRKADLFLPVRPGTDLAMLLAMLHVVVRDGLENRAFLEAHTTGWAEVAAEAAAWDPVRAARICGVPPEAIERTAHLIAKAERAILLHARGLEHHSKGVENCQAAINLMLTCGHIGREGAGVMMVTGQGNGQGGREHGQKCDQLPGQRSISDPAARAHVAKIWGIAPEELPGAGLTALEIVEAIHRGEIRGLLLLCFNPMVSLPDGAYVREALDKLAHFTVIDFFLSETAHHADVVLPGSLQEEEEGVVCSAEGRVIHIQRAVTPPDGARADTDILCELGRRLGGERHAAKFAFASPREVFDELRRASAGGVADYGGITYERIDREFGLFWPCPTEDHPGTPRLFEGGRTYHADGKAHLEATPWREGGDPLDAEFPIHLTTGRVVSQYLSGTQTRRIGPLVDQAPEPRLELHPTLADAHGIADGDWVEVTTRRGAQTFRALVVRTIRPDTVFVPYHWPGARSANRLTHRTMDPRSKIPEFKSSACRLAKGAPPPGTRRQLPIAGAS
ncbi:MAG: molybdopterin oxidoreductase family protein [Deltaproteobacteria bacterium]|nr:molybdopterin oxidoreductase family protein [Deltaproteobacteria bacterium]